MKQRPVARLVIGAVLAVLVVASIVIPLVRQRTAAKTVFSGFFFDTYVSFTLYGCKDEASKDTLLDLCSYYEDIFSATKEGSELYNINTLEWKPSADGSMTVDISRELYDCFELTGQYCGITGGRYNVAIRPVCELWDFSEHSDKTVPDASSIASALAHVTSDYFISKVTDNQSEEERASQYRLTLRSPGLRFDFGSVAKGYIADRLHDYILDNRIAKAAVIDLGGNIRCVGSKPGTGIRPDRAFTIGVQTPFSPVGVSTVNVDVRDKSVVTSGIYQRYFTYNGQIYHHILDATTGYPAGSDIVSVSIIDSSSARADVLSTVCFILGEDRARELLAREGADAIFIYSDGTFSKTY